MTARDVMRATNTPLLAKGFDAFSPIGPSVLSTSGLSADFDLAVRAWVNDELCQDGRTSDFIVGAADLASLISRYSTLHPGDVILTGTPAGTGQDRSKFLVGGDRIVVEVEGLLPLVSVLTGRRRSS
jgi:2-keto-4-pentenoate hydratase/2-oxohepta-3-ene-1,7-dioic acid hydratase in catechol pathway